MRLSYKLQYIVYKLTPLPKSSSIEDPQGSGMNKNF